MNMPDHELTIPLSEQWKDYITLRHHTGAAYIHFAEGRTVTLELAGIAAKELVAIAKEWDKQNKEQTKGRNND
jgi:hypothetical protein